GTVGFLLHLRDATEEPEADRADPDTAAAGGEGVTELVQQDRPEEADRAGYREQVGLGSAGVVEQVAVEPGEPDDHDEKEDEPGPVNRDPDSRDPEERYGAAAAEHSHIVWRCITRQGTRSGYVPPSWLRNPE